MNNNVILFQPLDDLKFFGNYLEPIAMELLASCIEEKGYNAVILPTNSTIDEVITSIEKYRPIAFGLSVHSYVYNSCLSYAKTAKEKAKELGYALYTIFGGYHPTALPNDVAMKDEVDFVVIGEGEYTLLELLESLKNKKTQDNIKGLAFKKHGKIINTGRRQRIKNLDSLPFAKRFKEYMNIKINNTITYPAGRNQTAVARLSYSRGCPFGCYFCQSKNLMGKGATWRSPKSILDEIEILIDKFNVNYIAFIDLTFNADKKRTLDICKEFKKRNLPVYWGAQVRVDILDEEQIIAMKEAKCTKFSIGVESPNIDVVKKLKGYYKINNKHLHNILNFIDNMGILLRLYFMIGLLHETKEVIMSYPDEWQYLPYDEALISFATPLPGTSFFEECLLKKILPEPIPWQNFNLTEPIIDLPNISKEELGLIYKEIYKKTYFNKNYIEHVRKKLNKFPYLANAWPDHLRIVKYFGISEGYEKEYNELMNIAKDAGAIY